ncbi:MAG: family 1 glycosylhydrolase [Verrucomicrobia bacterium]|nr:family 1 glycosylhydrolase [Verrucomicrobiota bacterium]
MNHSTPFLIGVATSGYQSEGGYNGPGEPQNNWGACEKSGRVDRTGRAVDFWNRYRGDFDLARGMGLNAFRLSIEWTRVQPSFTNALGPAPAFDGAAVDAYADRVAACREAGMEPVVTLQHFTHPAWLGVDAWLDDGTPGAFQKFVQFTIERLNQRLCDHFGQPPVRWYVTLNEPNMLVLNTYLNRHFPGGPEAGIPVGLRAYNRMLAAHVRAYNAIPEALSRHFTHIALQRRTDLAAMAGAGLHRLANYFASRAATSEAFEFFFTEAERAPRARALDYLGLDYYDPFVSHALRAPDFSDLEFKSWSISAHMLDVLACKWWDWHFLPEGMTAFCQYYASAFPGMAILIAENGMALRSRIDDSGGEPRRDKITRSAYLEAHLLEVRRMLDAGVPVVGYLHWSLTDNYEWGSFSPRFGLYRIDFQRDLARLEVDHLGDRPSQTYARLVREMGLNSLTVNLP